MPLIEAIFLSSSVLTLITGVIILLINPWRLINRAYLIAAGLSAVWLFCIFMAMHVGNSGAETRQPEILFWLRLSNATAAFLPWSYFLIKGSILETKSAGLILKRSAPWALVSGLLVIVIFSESFIPSDSSTDFKKRGIGYPIYLTVLAVWCTVILYDALRVLRRCQGISRIEMKFFAINFCLATLAIVLMFYLSSVLQLPLLRYMGAFVVVISFSLTIWAICYYRVFDAKQILLTAGQRVLLLGLLGGAAVGLSAAIEPVIQRPYGALLTTILACGLAVPLDRRAKQWLGLDPALLLQRSRQTIIAWARSESDENKLISYFGQYLARWCQTDHALLWTGRDGEFAGHDLVLPADWPGWDLLNKEGWITPESLHRRRESPATGICLEFLSRHSLGALLAVPRGSATPSLLVALGQKHSLRPYTYPDIQMLLELAEVMDNILTHSRVAARTAQIEKLEAAAMMSRGLAHDLNNLATPVSSFLLHMENRVTPDTVEAEVLADAKHSILVMQDYIRESLFYARRLVPDFQPVSSTELLASTLGLTQARARARSVEVEIGPSVGLAFRADRVLLLRMLQNLVSNGIDASPAGGRVILAAEPHGMEHIRFTVADDGPGVPAAIIDRIFKPYFTTKDTGNRTRGLGLGLAISLKIGSLHGGTITVGRASSGGALFTATLPLSPRSLV